MKVTKVTKVPAVKNPGHKLEDKSKRKNKKSDKGFDAVLDETKKNSGGK